MGFNSGFKGLNTVHIEIRDMWVPVTTAWRVLRLRTVERPPMWRVAANILNKQSRTTDKGWSSSLGVRRGANNSSPQKRIMLQNGQRVSLGPGLILQGYTGFWWGYLREGDYLDDPGVDGRIILRRIFRK